MKHIILCLNLVFIFTLGYSQSTNPDSLKILQIRAVDTDASIEFELAQHYTFYNPTATSQNTLVLHLVGSFDNPLNTIKFPSLAANNGFHVIGLKYKNGISSQGACKNSTDTNCYLHFRKEIVEGIDVSTEVTVDSVNSIQNRLIKLLAYLVNEHPTQNWGQFLTSNTINWEKVIVSGHSQGGGHAAYLGQTRSLKRVIMFSSPNDWSDHFNAPATWLNDQKNTPIQRFYGFNNVNDDVVDFDHQYQIWQDLGILSLHDTISVSSSQFNNTTSPALYTSYHKSGTSANHNATVRDSDTPVDMNGNAEFEAVWLYLLGIDESGSLLTKQIHSLQVYPNPTSNYIHFPIPQIESIILYNALGSPVALDLTNQQLMDVSKLNSGLYYGKAFTSKQVYRFHFVKM